MFPKSTPKSIKKFPKFTQIVFKSSQNLAKMFKKRPRASRRHPKGAKKCPRSVFEAILAPTWLPKPSQNEGQNAKKSMLASKSFFDWILSSFWLCFGDLFGRIFGTKTCCKNKNVVTLKSLKIVVFPR